ncbi:helix-turn-helix domain-containing protein [Streptomyces sp. KS_5]|uniref:winged helix-turn-helix transcriptional regulator n=1 Tax=Streptomyces sp. KS_5 TaxID=1881018 RepID=UPI000B812387|nr:helix-turn-helix domain-containing protein [Streptomyces sp. KS_5]
MEIPENKYCSIARSLEVVGQKWNLLILRQALWGHTRFAQFRKIGVPSDVLTARLASLVEDGLLERRPYREPGERVRDEYLLTDAGRDLLPVLAAFAAWGDKHRPTGLGPAAVFVDETTNRPVTLAFVHKDRSLADSAEVRMTPGPGITQPS